MTEGESRRHRRAPGPVHALRAFRAAYLRVALRLALALIGDDTGGTLGGRGFTGKPVGILRKFFRCQFGLAHGFPLSFQPCLFGSALCVARLAGVADRLALGLTLQRLGAVGGGAGSKFLQKRLPGFGGDFLTVGKCIGDFSQVDVQLQLWKMCGMARDE